MTPEQWNALKPGDVLIDHASSNQRRTIFQITHVKGTRGQGANVRTCLTVTNLKSNGGRTILFASERTGCCRFELVT